MSYFLIIFLLLCAYHFILDGIIAPSFRLSIRYKLFALRDELRRVKIEQGEKLDDSVFQISDEAMCRSINNLSNLTIYSLFMNKKHIKANENLRQELNQRISKIENCKNLRIKELNDRAAVYSAKALLVNSWAWALYLFPIVIVLLILIQLGFFVFKMNSWVRDLCFSPNREFDQLNSETFLA
jgi:hypothetical protein